MSEEYIKKEDALKAICKFCPRGDNGLGLSPCLFPEYCISDELNELNSLPTHSIPEMIALGEYIRKADMEKILYSTNNAVRIGELFTELPTYAFYKTDKPEEIEVGIDDEGYPFGKRIMSDKFFPDSAKAETAKPEEWVIDFSNIKDAELESIKAEIHELDVEDLIFYEGTHKLCHSEFICKDDVMAIIDKHLGGEDK